MLALAFPGGFLEPVWRLKPEAHRQFLQIGSGASIGLMVIVGAACGLAAIGLVRNADGGAGSQLEFSSSIFSAIH
jgi:hypothetical protein